MKREERICKNCRSGEVEDVEHLVMRCEQVNGERIGGRVGGRMAGYGGEREGGSSNGQSIHRSNSRKSNGENLEEVYSLWTTSFNQILTGG